MKKILACLTLIGATVGLYAQVEPPKHDWKAIIKVVDESGQPVTEAKMCVYYHGTNEFTGESDIRGTFVAAYHDASEDLAFLADKPGYYPAKSVYHMGRNYKPEKWNPVVILTLRKIGNPIPMYAKRLRTKLEMDDQPMGFDLEIGDWVTPLGKGKQTDIHFMVHRKILNEKDYDCTLVVSFPNKGDGITVAPAESFPESAFKTSRTALDERYKPELILHYTRIEQPAAVFGYFIRVRTILNEDGTVKSAFYGKIPDGFKFYAGTKAPKSGMGFDYYLNPTANDRNLEFDPQKNLIKNLKPLEAVKEP